MRIARKLAVRDRAQRGWALGLLALSQSACGSSDVGGTSVPAGQAGAAAAAGNAAQPASGGAPVLGTGGTGPGIDFGGQSAGGGAPAGGAPDCVGDECIVGCGNGRIDPGLDEVCDDGNSVPQDGCSADCKTVETDFACPEPGAACVSLVDCADGRIAGAETCDDGNELGADGCSADCQLEPSWECPSPGDPCTPRCGDGVLAGDEQCDAPAPGLGCSAACRIEPGYLCDAPPVPATAAPASCRPTVCGDGVKEGSEACDDGGDVDGDGCSGACTLEPECDTGVCVSRCGDAIRLSPEGCDDGNLVDGDGCSAGCGQESGYTCEDNSLNPPEALNLFATYRDVVSIPLAGPPRHPDFEAFAGDDVTERLTALALDAEGKPVMDGRCSEADAGLTCPYGQMLTTEANFSQWFRDSAGVNLAVPDALLLTRLANGSYVYDSGDIGFYPIDGRGWTADPYGEGLGTASALVNDGGQHNFGFTTEIRYFFQYRGGESLAFSGDDDLWVFINRGLALDVGGLHPPAERTLVVDQQAADLGLTVGGVYEIALFHAERHTDGSNFKLTLTGFAPTYSTCGPTCGDGVVAAGEQCDLGTAMNTGLYNGCTAQCERGPRCGDAILQSPEEQCDDGVNLTTYSMTGAPGCAPGCVLSGICGDASVDGLFGEECDLGSEANADARNGCSPTCELGRRCGDGTLQGDLGEECDDGNTVGGDGCTHDCRWQEAE